MNARLCPYDDLLLEAAYELTALNCSALLVVSPYVEKRVMWCPKGLPEVNVRILRPAPAFVQDVS